VPSATNKKNVYYARNSVHATWEKINLISGLNKGIATEPDVLPLGASLDFSARLPLFLRSRGAIDLLSLSLVAR
jgi:hypothetical protein